MGELEDDETMAGDNHEPDAVLAAALARRAQKLMDEIIRRCGHCLPS